MVVGYVRRSTQEQDLSHQIGAIQQAAQREGWSLDKIIEETISSRKDDRQVYRVVEGLGAGDALIVYELSRLGRSVSQVFELVQQVRRKDAKIICLQPELRIGNGDQAMTDAIIFALGLASGIERDLISERTKSGLAARKAQGVKLGRPKGSKLDARAEEIKRYQDLGLGKTSIAKLLGCSRSALYHFLETRA